MQHIFRYILLFVVLFCSENVVAQMGLYGYIKDTEGKGVPNVNVIVREKDNKKIIAYTISKDDGYFIIEKNLDFTGAELSAKCIGYKEFVKSLKDVAPPINITLVEEKYQLKEVEIVPKPIHARGDTTIYLLSSFIDGTEKNVEEALKKLPGIEVSDEGQVSFRGKSIKKILLDNVDLFDENYKVASKTIPASFISTVEAIEHYHENRLLKKVENSEDVVLNLSLKSDMNLQRPVGQVSLGGGFENRYNLLGNLMSMNKYVKLYDAANFTNTSSSSWINKEDDALLPIDLVNDYFGKLGNSRDNVRNVEQKAESNTFNIVYKPNKKITVRGQFLADKNRNTSNSRERTMYFADSLLIEKNTSLKMKPVLFDGNLKLTYDIGENTILTYEGKYKSINKRIDNEFNMSNLSDYQTNVETNLQTNDLELTHSLKNNSVIIFYFSTFACGNTQQFDFSGAETHIDQYLKNNRFLGNSKLSYYKRNKKINWNVSGGFNFDKNNSDIVQNQGESSLFSDYTNAVVYIGGDIAYSIKAFTIGLNAPVRYRKQKINTVSLGSKVYERAEITPTLTYKLELGKHCLSTSATYKRGQLSPFDYLSYYTDYRDFHSAAEAYNDEMSDISLNANYTFLSMTGTYALASYTYSISKNDFFDRLDISPSVSYMALGLSRDRKTQLGIISVKHYVDAIRHGFDITTSVYGSNYYNMVNSNQIRYNKSLSFSSKISLKSSFAFPVNYVLGAKYGIFSFRFENAPTLTNSTYSFFQDIVYKINKDLNLKLSIDEFFLGKDKKMYFFVSPNVEYNMKKYSLTVGLSAYNVLNKDQISDYYLNDYYSTEYTNSIVRAMYLLNIRFRY